MPVQHACGTPHKEIIPLMTGHEIVQISAIAIIMLTIVVMFGAVGILAYLDFGRRH
jgi:hypothetical protein